MLLHLCDGSLKIGRIQMTEYQSRGFCVPCELSNDIRRSVQRAFCADAHRHMQDEQVGATGELGKTRISAGLVVPKMEMADGNQRELISARTEAPFPQPLQRLVTGKMSPDLSP